MLRNHGRFLSEGVELLAPDDPDILFGLSHIGAVEDEGACGCGDMANALSMALRRLVLRQLPAGLLGDITVQLQAAGPPNITVQLDHPPSVEEQRLLDAVICQGMATLRAAIGKGGRR